MKKTIYLLGLLYNILLVSCGESAKPTPITFVFDAPIEEGNYPEYFYEIVEPFETSDCEMGQILKPINVTRLDIKNAPVTTNAWYFEQMGDNTVEFSKNWLSQYFKDSLVVNHLVADGKKEVSDKIYKRFFEKEDVLSLVYSEDAENDIFFDKPVFTSPSEIVSELRSTICSKPYKEVVIVVNPKQLKSIDVVTVQQKSLDTETEQYQNANDPCQTPTTNQAFTLKDDLIRIIDSSKPMVDRVNIAEEVWAKYFHPDAYVGLYRNAKGSAYDVWDPGMGKNYLTNRLAILASIHDVAIFRIETASDGRISGIHVVECQNASEAL